MNLTVILLKVVERKAGLSGVELAAKLAAISADGATVMPGQHNGVIAQVSCTLKQAVQKICPSLNA